MRSLAWRSMLRQGQPNMFGWHAPRGSGALRPPPPFAAPLRCALTPAATPRDGPSAEGQPRRGPACSGGVLLGDPPRQPFGERREPRRLEGCGVGDVQGNGQVVPLAAHCMAEIAISTRSQSGDE
jgi:hypothetical protein